MKKLIASTALAVLAVLGPLSAARADVIDFNGLAGNPVPGGDVAKGLYTRFVDPLELQGYTFSSTKPYDRWQYIAGDLNALIFCRGYADRCAANGSDYLLGSTMMEVRRTDGGMFSLNAFELGNYYDSGDDAAPAQQSYRFRAWLADGGTVERILTLDAVPNALTSKDFNRFAFDDLGAITAFDIEQVGTRDFYGIVLDNLDVGAAAVNAVPEPASLALVGLGLAVLAARRRSRRA